EIHVQTSEYGGSRATYLKYELTNVMVTSFQTASTTAGDVAMEEITLNYESIKTSEDKPKRARKK
ncbi:MAG: type VI secretion system tube protein Hcp, partial [Sphingomonadales bacterium]